MYHIQEHISASQSAIRIIKRIGLYRPIAYKVILRTLHFNFIEHVLSSSPRIYDILFCVCVKES
jgi:hypothetical protein